VEVADHYWGAPLGDQLAPLGVVWVAPSGR
jgi:hypothetical protein